MNEVLHPVVCCHQPNFFPWLGYFHKIRWSDTFVVLDDVPLQKSRSSHTNRVALWIGGAQKWVTAPVDRSYHGSARICDVRFARDDDWRVRFVSSVKLHYARAPYFAALGPAIFGLIEDDEPCLAAYNMRATLSLMQLLGIATNVVYASTFDVRETSSLRLAELVRCVGGRSYLAGAGAADYQDDSVFAARGIAVLPQRFEPPEYLRAGKPGAAGLSVIDALFWLGAEGTRALLERPVPPGAGEGSTR